MSVKCHEKFRVCTLEHPQKNQITLHTGVVYARHSSETFCAVSYSLEHGPQAVWSYIRPALEKLLQEKKGIDTLHFYSDGATAQYKQKGNFNLLSKEMSDRSICKATWNFHESGHGKGVQDSVGDSLKETGNTRVLHGQDIIDAASFVSSIQEQDTSVYLYEPTKDRIPSIPYEQKLKNLFLEHIKFTRSRLRILEKYGSEMSVVSVNRGRFMQTMSGNLLKLLRK